MDEGPNIATPPTPRRLRRALRLAGRNALLLIAGLALIGLAGEAWRRSTIPFIRNHAPTVFVPDVGLLRPPHTEFRWTNGVDFWIVSPTPLRLERCRMIPAFASHLLALSLTAMSMAEDTY